MHVLLGKVKSGYFAMPQWLPSDVKDLLQRMLTVDPAKRITLHQILMHPALTHATQDYAAPTSIPLEQKVNRVAGPASLGEEELIMLCVTHQIARAVDELPLDEEILRSLHSLGWDDRESLQRALLSSEPAIEKAFYRLLHKRKRRRTKGRFGGPETHVQKVHYSRMDLTSPFPLRSLAMIP